MPREKAAVEHLGRLENRNISRRLLAGYDSYSLKISVSFAAMERRAKCLTSSPLARLLLAEPRAAHPRRAPQRGQYFLVIGAGAGSSNSFPSGRMTRIQPRTSRPP